MKSLEHAKLLVVGAGTMGAGIVQVAAQAGHEVLLHDMRPGAAAQACAKLATTLDGLVGKGKLDGDEARATLARIKPINALEEARGCGLVVEAIIEDVDAKRKLFAEMEALLDEQAVLATNTSSLSITAIARELKQPGRLVGMHFFNPVPLMKLVEVVSGLRTDPAAAAAVFDLALNWGKVPVHAQSTPGFIVNRIARPYYAEALALLHEKAATPDQLDAALRGAGFRMGPCELMDLIGHDVNYAVTESVYAANYGDKRYAPSRVQRELVDGGMLGRKSGRGFYQHPHAPPPQQQPERGEIGTPVTLHGGGPLADWLVLALSGSGVQVAREAGDALSLQIGTGALFLTDGRPAQQLAADLGQADVAVFDWLLAEASGSPVAYAVAASASEAFARRVASLLAAASLQPLRVADAAGLVVARTVAMLINEAADAVQQGVCDEKAADTAMRLGVNYPAGPFEWLKRVGVAPVCELLAQLNAHYRGERYRISPWLQQRAWREAVERHA